MNQTQNNISVSIITLNEEISLKRCLDSVSWSNDIVIIDSYSTDNTETIAKTYKNVTFKQRKFDDYSSQRNFALHDMRYKNEWILIIDADEVCPEELKKEILEKINKVDSDTVVFHLRRKEFFRGKWVRHNNEYPVWYERLIKPEKATYTRAINERLTFEGEQDFLENHIHHYPFSKGIAYWIDRHNKYSTMEAHYERENRMPVRIKDFLNSDPLYRRKTLKNLSLHLPLRALVFFLYNFFFKFCFLDGRKGIQFVLLKTFYVFMLELKVKNEGSEKI